MAGNESAVLDGLAWTQLSEAARVAKVASNLVRNTSSYHPTVTKTAIQLAVRDTLPPHGRGKAICEAVAKEIDRQRPIWQKRQEEERAWADFIVAEGKMSTRLNHAYAARFARPTHSTTRPFPGNYGDWEGRQKWNDAENARDLGDCCIGLVVYRKDYTVVLISSNNNFRYGICFVAVQNRLGGSPCYTPLRLACENLVEAALSLGGPKVRSAIAQGLQVRTDWVGRHTEILHADRSVEILPWRTSIFTDDYEWDSTPVLVIGDETIVETPATGEAD